MVWRSSLVGLVALVVAAPPEDPLRGSWDTGPVPMRSVRAVMLAHGYTRVEIDTFWRRFGLARAENWEFNFRFYRRRRVPYVTKTGWDPTKGGQPLAGDMGPYSLLPKGRVAIKDQKSSTHRYREVYGYRIVGNTLRLRVISETDPTLTKKELRLDMLFMYAAAAMPLKRVP